MDGYAKTVAPRPASADWPGQLAAAASLGALFLVWLCVLPFAALAFCVISLIAAARRLVAPASRG